MLHFESCKKLLLQSKWRLYAVSIGLTLVLAPQYNLISLQTSIGVKDAMGPTSVAVYCTLCVATLLVYIPLMAKFGRKNCLVLGEIPSVIYTLSYFYPRPWVVTTAGVFIGIAESIIMPASGVVITSLSHPTDDGHEAQKNTYNVGVLLAIRGLGQAIASIVPNLILVDSAEQSSNKSTFNTYDVAQCGANDCPSKYAFQKHSEIFGNLIPTQDSLRIYLSVMAILQILGIIIHWLAIPNDDVAGNEGRQPLIPHEEKSAILELKDASYRLFIHMRSKFRWLTIPIHIMYGLNTGFIWSEITRAYISCPFGVENIGVFLILLYLAAFIGNAFWAKFCSSVPMPVIFGFNIMVSTSTYCLALFWIPSEASMYVPYILVVLMGFTHFFVRFSSYVISSNYFDDMDSAYVVQTGVVALGNAIVFVLSNVLCVYQKLYILIFFALFSTSLVFVGHFCYRPSK